MSALTRTPVNQNFLQSNKFQVNFSRLPNTQFFTQMVTVPGISMGEASQPTPFLDLFIPGDKAIYEPLVMTFYVDEQMESWVEIHNWIRAMTFPKNFDEYKNIRNLNNYTKFQQAEKPQYSDCTVTVLTSANKPMLTFKYYDVFPITLSGIMMNTTEGPETPITSDAEFRYSYYDIIKNS
jgi:hypothetical protein